MNYIYMDNYRGFENTFVPVDAATFLVGENSTGKSSFLKLVYLFSKPQFWFGPGEAFNDHVDMGGFHDIVSAWAEDKSYFRIGLVAKSEGAKDPDVEFAILEFGSRSGSPALKRFVTLRDGNLVNVIYEKKRTKYKFSPCENLNNLEGGELFSHARALIESSVDDNHGFTFLPIDFPPNPPVPILLSVINTVEKGESKKSFSFEAELPNILDLTWIAPIRTSPQRFYDGLRHSFSPEGEHTPFVLRRSLRTRSKTSSFVDKLSAFGLSSGLFESIKTHSFGNSPQAPFEILIKFSNVDLNINNVGYGVSQVLPLVVEFLSHGKGKRFAIQQPEVHLHPKAQAALGDLVFALMEERNHEFVIETHSDFLIDRFRLAVSRSEHKIDANVLFFSRRENGNRVTPISISSDGRYVDDLPNDFRGFFIKEDLALLDL